MDRIAIATIGGGPAALFFLHELLKTNVTDVSLTVFEKSGRLGAGMPYSSAGAKDEHLANVSPNELPVLPCSVEHWLNHKTPRTALYERFRHHYSEYRVLPRLVLGDYLSDEFAALVDEAKKRNWSVTTLLHTQVVDLVDHGDRIVVVTANGERHPFNRVVICTGHQWPTDREETNRGWFDSPYPPEKIYALTDPQPVAIRGASLTAFDAVRTLARRFGNFHTDDSGQLLYTRKEGADAFRMVMFTRHGFLPAVRIHMEDPHFYREGVLTQDELAVHMENNDGFLSLDYIFEHDFKKRLYQKDPGLYARVHTLSIELFVKEMLSLREKLDPFVLLQAEYAEAEKSIRRHQSVYWKELLGALSFTLNYPAKYFSAEDTERLHKTLLPLISVVIAFIPQPTCRELLALHRAGVLDLVEAGAESDVQPHEAGGAVYHFTTPAGEVRADHYPVFIDATGQRHLPYESFPFKSLLDSRTVTPATVRYRQGAAGERMRLPGVAINDYFQAVDDYGAGNERVYIVAVPLIGGYNPDYSGLDFCEEAARRVVEGMFGKQAKEPPAIDPPTPVQ